MPPLTGFAGGLAGTGESLGNAHGTITLDISDLLRAEQISRTVGQNIEKNLGGIGTASDAAAGKVTTLGGVVNSISSQFNGLKQSILGANAVVREFRTEIAAIGLGAGLLTKFGLGAANELRVARIRLRQFVETEEEANALMGDLTIGANKFGLELGAVLSFASTLLPVIEGNVDAVDEWVERAARLRTVFPAAVRGSELRAISEFISGNVVSLQRLFNIAPSLIQEAKAQFTDIGQQLDYILDRMGATTEAAQEIADPMVAVKNELKLIAAVGFDPILQKLRELLPEVRQWLEGIRETHPEILEMGGAFVTAAAIGAPFLLFANQVLSTLIKIKQLGLLGTLGKAGLVGLGIAAAPAAAGGIVRGVGRGLGDDRAAGLSNMEVLREAVKAVADLFFSFAAFMAPVNQLIVNALLQFAQAVVDVYSGLGTLLERIGGLLPPELGGDKFSTAGGAIRQAAESLTQSLTEAQQRNDQGVQTFLETINRDRMAFAAFLERVFGQSGGSAGEGEFGGAIGTEGAGGLTEEEQAQIEAWEQYQEAIGALNQRANEQAIQATEQYNAARLRIITQYEKAIARESAAFARQRARDIIRLNDDIDSIRGETLSNEAEWWRELQETIANLRQESAARITEIEADANREREQMERQHRVNLLEAASRLDALAIASEQRRFGSQVANFDQDLKVRLQKERDNLNERIAAEEVGHQKRVAAQRKEDEKRIQAMIEAQDKRHAIEDEDRAIRLAEMKEDHLQQLTELKTSHRDRLKEIKEQVRRELIELKDKFAKQNLELTRFYDKWLATQAANQAASLREWDRFWKEWYAMQRQAAGGGETGTTGGGDGTGTGTGGGEERPTKDELLQLAKALAIQSGYSEARADALIRSLQFYSAEAIADWIERVFKYDVPGYAQGTMNVPNTGLALVHKGEIIIDAITSRFIRSNMNQSRPQLAAAGMTTNNRSLNLGGVNIYAAANHSVQDIGQEVERRLVSILESFS